MGLGARITERIGGSDGSSGKPATKMRAVWNGAVLAESDRTVKLKGNHYVPPDSLNHEYLMDSDRRTVCPWKGSASYYTVEVVKKMGLYRVKGRFRVVDGTVEFGPAGSSADLMIDASSVTTRMPRDLHLRSADFLDAKRHPEIAVRADAVEGAPDGELRVPATFEIRGRRAEVELTGHAHGGDDGELILHLGGELDRHAFGIRARQPFEMVVGRQVELDAELVLEAVGGA